jgi:hypothetical protein
LPKVHFSDPGETLQNSSHCAQAVLLLCGMLHRVIVPLLGIPTGISIRVVSNCSLETCANDRILFLKPSRGTMSISATFKDVLVTNSESFLGCRINVCMGRLDCSTAPFALKLTATTSVASKNGVNICNSENTDGRFPPQIVKFQLSMLRRVHYFPWRKICIPWDLAGSMCLITLPSTFASPWTLSAAQ